MGEFCRTQEDRPFPCSCSHVVTQLVIPEPGAGELLEALWPDTRPPVLSRGSTSRGLGTPWSGGSGPVARALVPLPLAHLVNSVHLDAKLAPKAPDGVHLGAVLGELRLVLVADG